MKLWKRASGALKDHNSLWLANFTRRSALRNPEIEVSIIKATSHDETSIDYRNTQRVFAWMRMSPSYLKPILWAISMRMERTRDWVVAIKGLMLLHGVFCCRVPAVYKIGRLPFDLSNFKDGHSNPQKTWAYNDLVRAYFAYLDQKSTFLFLNMQEHRGKLKESTDDVVEQTMMQELLKLQKFQGLLDMLLQIKPQTREMLGCLVLEAMECVLIEISDIYSKICHGIARVLMKIYSAGKVEAALALKVMQKATKQGEKLPDYFDFCREIGVINAVDCPTVEQIPEEDIRELEDIINGVSERSKTDDPVNEKAIVVQQTNQASREAQEDTAKAMEVMETEAVQGEKASMTGLKTIITNNWEMFDEDFAKNAETSTAAFIGKSTLRENPFGTTLTTQPIHVHAKSTDLPDLITLW